MTGRRPNKKKKNNGRRSSKKRTRRRAHYGGRPEPEPEPEPEPQLADEQARIAHLEDSVSTLTEQLRLEEQRFLSVSASYVNLSENLVATRSRWRVQYDECRQALADSQQDLADSQQDLADSQQALTDCEALLDGSGEE